MLQTLQVIIPMSGSGARFAEAGYKEPKPLIKAAGRPFITHLIERFPADTRWVFVAREDHLESAGLRDLLEAEVPTPHIVAIPAHKLGPVHAVMQAEAVIDPTLPTVVNYCDFSFEWDVNHFRRWAERLAPDGAVVCYRGFHPHHQGDSRYAYCKTDAFGVIAEVQEKEAFTERPTEEWASTGTYYFKTGQLAVDRARDHIANDRRVNGEFYVSLVMDDMVRQGEQVLVYEVDRFCQWGTPQDLEDWEYWNRAFAALTRSTRHKAQEAPATVRGRQVLIPMGGKGERLRRRGAIKPLVTLHQRPMFLLALEFLPQAAEPLLIVRREHEHQVSEVLGSSDRDTPTYIAFDGDTDGQASTCLLAMEELLERPDGPLWISACDHGVVLSPMDVEALEASPVDLCVVGVRGYPPARRDPNAYSWIDVEPLPLGKVHGVGLKSRPASPLGQDAVLVGTFYFRSSHAFITLLKALIARELRTHGERYLDAIVQLALEQGLNVRWLETEAFLCWGTEAAIDEYVYWHRHFLGSTP